MWREEGDFLADLDELDEICTSVQQNDDKRSEFQRKQNGYVSNTRRRVRLYSDDDDDLDITNPQYSSNVNDTFNYREIGNQIKLATGNVYNNEEIMKYWGNNQTSTQNNTPVQSSNTNNAESLVFESKIDSNHILALEDISNQHPTVIRTRIGKQSVANQIRDSLNTIRMEESNRETEMKNITCRISIPVDSNELPNIPKIDTETSSVSSRSTSRCSTRSNASDISIASSKLNVHAKPFCMDTGHKNNFDIKSKSEFPPLS